MSKDPASAMKAGIRADLVAAIKAKRAEEVSTLRSLLAAIDNAEAPALDAQAIADGPSEIERLTLSSAELHAVLVAELRTREVAADELAGLGQERRAQALRDQAAIIGRYLTAEAAQDTGASPT